MDDTRDVALRAIYEADRSGTAAPDLEGQSAKARRLVRGVLAHLEELDETLGEVAEGWAVGRMPVVDRSLLRLGLYELRYEKTPVGVVISEAVRLAKEYSTERSAGFVNGVLATLAAREREEGGGRL